MKSRYRFLLLLTFLLLSSTAFADRFPVRQEFGQTRPAGRATLADTSQGGNGAGGLVVSNIGSSGQDGVDFRSGGTRGQIGPIKWMAPESITDRGKTVVLTGRDAAGAAVQLACIIREQEEGFGGDLNQSLVTFNPMATGIATVTMTIRSNGNPLHTQNGTATDNPLFETSVPPTGTSGSGQWGEASNVFDHFRLYYPTGTTFDLLDGQTVVGDEVALTFESWQTEMESLAMISVLGIEPPGSTSEFFITDWPAAMFGQVLGSLGAAEVFGIGSSGLDGVDRLRVSNIGSSGQDGVYMHTDGTSSSQGFLLDFPNPPVAGNKLFVGGLSYAEGDGSGMRLPTVKCEYHADSFFDIWTESAADANPSLMEYLHDGEVVEAILGPTSGAQLYTSAVSPDRIEFKRSSVDVEVEILFGSDVLYPLTPGGSEFGDADGVRLTFSGDPAIDWDALDGVFMEKLFETLGGEFFISGLPNEFDGPTSETWSSAAAEGGANLVFPASGILVADNIRNEQGAPGTDGLRIVWPHGSSDLGITMDTRSKRPPPTRGHVTVLKAFGSGGDKADHSDGIATLTGIGNDADTLIEFEADMSPVGLGGATWNFYDGGLLVGTETRSNSEVCFGTDAVPVFFSTALDPSDGRPTMRFDFADARPITFIGGDPANQKMTKADLIEVIYDGAIVTPFTDVTDLAWRGRGQGAMYVTNAGPAGSSSVPTVVAGSVLTLRPVAPNPFNPRTVVAFDLRRDAFVTLKVYDARGRHVQDLHSGFRAAGTYHETWNGMDSRGRSVASGTYFFRLSGAGSESVRKAVLIR